MLRVARGRDPDTTLDDLEHLSQDTHPWVRWSVSENLRTPAEMLKRLSTDADESVRYGVASNHRTPVEALLVLSRDPDERVRDQVAKNPSSGTREYKSLETIYEVHDE
jgi:hypothetical protein